MTNHRLLSLGNVSYYRHYLRHQRGEGMLSFLIALGLMVVLSPIAFQYLQKSMDLDTAGAAAYHATQISEARDRYIKDNYATILANAAAGPVSITTTMLKNAGYLDAAINDLNINNQTYQTRAIKVTAGGNDLLRVLTVTSGGQEFSETEIRNIAAKTAKIGGGFISSLDTAVAQGYRGSYQVTLADYGLSPGAGHVAIGGFFNSQGVLGDYLYRNAIPGHPELNQMNTALSMGGNAINSVSTLTATGNITTTNNVQGGDLLATRDMTAGRNIAAAGDVSGTNITAIGTISGRDLLASRNLNVSGNIAVNGTITAGDSISSNGTVSGAYLRPTTDATEGAYCASNGLIAKTSSGLILSCQSGVWRSNGGVLTVNGDVCPDGYATASYYVPITVDLSQFGIKSTYAWQGHNYVYRCRGGGDRGQTCGEEQIKASQVKCIR